MDLVARARLFSRLLLRFLDLMVDNEIFCRFGWLTGMSSSSELSAVRFPCGDFTGKSVNNGWLSVISASMASLSSRLMNDISRVLPFYLLLR